MKIDFLHKNIIHTIGTICRFSAYTVLMILVISCNKSNDKVLLDPAQDEKILSEYFAAATVGVISSNDNLKYILREPLSDSIPFDILQGTIKVSPDVKGVVSLTNNTVLQFIPENKLSQATLYDVQIDLTQVDPLHFKNKIQYKIKTLAQSMIVQEEGFLLEDDGSASLIIGITTADETNEQELQSCFSSKTGVLSVRKKSTRAYELICNYASGFPTGEKIEYDGKSIQAQEKGVIELPSFSKNENKVVSTYHDVVNKEFKLFLSQIVNDQQDFNGLITVANKNAEYAVRNNIITIFLHSIQIGETVDIILSKGIKSTQGLTLLQDAKYSITIQSLSPEAQFVSDGNYFPSEGDFNIPIKTKNLSSVRIVVIEIKQVNVMHYLAWQSLDYTDYDKLRMYGTPIYDKVTQLERGVPDAEGWTYHGLDLTNQLEKTPGSIYHISLDFAPEHSTLPCAETIKNVGNTSKIPDANFFKIKDYYYSDYFYYDEDFNWNETNDPCKFAFYAEKNPVHRVFICSDYGVIAKQAGNDYYIALTRLMDATEVSDAEVSAYNMQGLRIDMQNTSSSGFCTFKAVDADVAVIKVEKNAKITYISLDPYQNNALTDFNIEGDRSAMDTEFFIYTERDVWRPGDEIFMDVMINKSQSTLPANVPITVKFYNVKNILIDEQIQNINTDKNLIYSFRLKTNASDLTGLYMAKIQIGAKQLYKYFRVETIKPNTSDIEFTFDNVIDKKIYSPTFSGSFNVQYLTGFPIIDASVKINARAKKIKLPFKNYEEYNFDVYDRYGQDYSIFIPESQTNNKGVSTFASETELTRFNTPVQIYLESEISLPGGGLDKEGSSVQLFPFTNYIGARKNKGSAYMDNYTDKDPIIIDLISISDKGKIATKTKNINYKIQKSTNSWWIDKYSIGSDGNYKSYYAWKDEKSGFVIVNGKGQLTFSPGQLSKGLYQITFTNPDNEHTTQVYFAVNEGNEQVTTSQPHYVNVKTDKDSYKPSEDIVITLPTIKDAKALVSIEVGNKVLQQSWHALKGDEVNKINIKVQDDWTPNVYIHTAIIQGYKQTNNDLPTRLYSVNNVVIDNQSKKLTPVSSLQQVMQSNQTYEFTVSEKDGKAMEYTIALVDEGLLNLTGFTSPDPSIHFNGKIPLLVKTWDIYKYLIEYFKGKIAGIVSIGGDNAFNPEAIAQINRFKPVIMHYGPFALKKSDKNKHKFTLPNYIGKLRLVVVACSQNNEFGSSSTLHTVKNPLMVQSQLPRSLNVTDKITIPVTVLKDDGSINNANLAVTSSNDIISVKSPSKSINLSSINQQTTDVSLEIMNKVGNSVIQMDINGGGKSMTEKTDLTIRYPNSYQNDAKEEKIVSGSSFGLSATSKGYATTYKATISIGGQKLPKFAQYATDLITYPYGCLEQTVSAAFGQLYLDKILLLDAQKNAERLQNLELAMQKLATFQGADGKFNYWNNNYYNGWADIYTGNFLVSARTLNTKGNINELLNKWITIHSSEANSWAVSNTINPGALDNESILQAYRLYVLAKAGKSAKSALNRFNSSNTSKNPLVWFFIAGAYQASGFGNKATENVLKAESLVNGDMSYSTDNFSFGDNGRNLAIIVEILSSIDGMNSKVKSYYDQMVTIVNKSYWVSTQTKGYVFAASYKYFGKAINANEYIEYTIDGLKGGKINRKHSPFQPFIINIDPADVGKKITINNIGKGEIIAIVNERYISNDLQTLATSNKLKLSVQYINNTKKGDATTNTSLGDDISIIVQVSNTEPFGYNNLALSVKMPSGWELINPRVYNTSTPLPNNNFDYQDYKDDRVHTFFGLSAKGNETFVFKAKAAFIGDFYLPSISCEHMYQGDVSAKTKWGRAIVKK